MRAPHPWNVRVGIPAASASLAAFLRGTVRDGRAVGIATAHPLSMITLRVKRRYGSLPHCPAARYSVGIGIGVTHCVFPERSVANCT